MTLMSSMTSTPRLFVYALSVEAAHQWCRRNGYQPFARTTYILSSRSGRRAARGFLIRDEDRVVFVGPVAEDPYYWNVWSALAPALVNVGFLEKVEWVDA